jgi:outer membrane lipoprotein
MEKHMNEMQQGKEMYRAGSSMRQATIPFLIVPLLLSACAAIPSEVLRQADQGLTLADAIRAPDRHREQVFLLGGTVMDRRDFPDRTLIRVRQHPLDVANEPQVSAPSEGEFLVISRPPIGRSDYPVGKRMTVVGRFTGLQPAGGGSRLESLPSFQALFLRPWADPARSPDRPYDPNYLDSVVGYQDRFGEDPCWDCFQSPFGGL